ncbi:MAG TPA: histidinol dehydrogenase, partial [Burkholderiaceae bacterium]|nr:histidinol dehydrogenase [Burkholderiaceae bacterium]
MKVRRLDATDPGFDSQFAGLIATDTAIDREVERVAGQIVDDVRRRGDKALLEYTNRFDRISATTVAELEVRPPEMREALDSLGVEQRGALETAADRIRAFHQRQLTTSWSYTETDGTELGQRIDALQSVGLYVPGGLAAYPS